MSQEDAFRNWFQIKKLESAAFKVKASSGGFSVTTYLLLNVAEELSTGMKKHPAAQASFSWRQRKNERYMEGNLGF